MNGPDMNRPRLVAVPDPNPEEQPEQVPAHVVAGFAGEQAGAPEPAGHAWDNGWRIGGTVYSRAGAHAGWSAKMREKLQVEGVRIARPVRSTDGRFVLAGWKANGWIDGTPTRHRVDETVGAALRLADALTGLVGPPSDTIHDDDPFVRADRLAWEETDLLLEPLDVPGQVGHADLLAATTYSGTQAPAVTDLVPFSTLRPHGYTAALVIVDGLLADTVDEAVIDRFAHIPHLGQLLLRAHAYRRHINELHPRASPAMHPHLARVRDTLVSRVSATI